MPTKEGWPTLDEERALRDHAKAKRGLPASHQDISDPRSLPMTVTLTLAEWMRLLSYEDTPERQKVVDMLNAQLKMAEDVR